MASGPEAAFRKVEPMVLKFAPNGVSYVGDGELARICKIAHNVMLGVVIQNLIEITLLANKMGVPREAFLRFMSNSVMGSMFTRYKSPAFVNLDWTTTFTPELLLKDLDLGLELGREWKVPMPATAATREVLQGHIGNAILQKDPKAYLEQDFATLMETMAGGIRHEDREREEERPHWPRVKEIADGVHALQRAAIRPAASACGSCCTPRACRLKSIGSICSAAIQLEAGIPADQSERRRADART